MLATDRLALSAERLAALRLVALAPRRKVAAAGVARISGVMPAYAMGHALDNSKRLVFENAAATVDALAQHLVAEIRSAIARSGRCTLALSGGSTPRRLFERLAAPDLSSSIDWGGVSIYWSDERCVPADDAASNRRMAAEALLDRVPIAADDVHPVDVSLEPHAAAAAYAELLGDEPLDLVLLGLGADGHTASLFPGDAHLRDERRLVRATRSPVPPHDRITLTLRALNAARRVVFLVLGADKAEVLADVARELGCDASEARLPAAMVRPATGTLHWFVDREAARIVEAQTGA